VPLRSGDEPRIKSLPFWRTAQVLDGADIESLVTLMGHPDSPQTFPGGENAFIEAVRFSPIISDVGSFKAVETVLQAYGRHVTGCYFGHIPSADAMQLHVVFPPAISGQANAMFTRQP
jgi:hypothetical protein